MIRPDIVCAVRTVARFRKPWTGPSLKYGDVVVVVVVDYLTLTDPLRIQPYWGIYYLLYTNEWGITFSEQGCGLSMEGSTTRNLSCLGNRRLSSGTVVTLAKGGGQLALEDTSSDGIRYLGGGIHCLIRDSRESSSFETGSAEFYGTADEDLT